MYKCVKIIPKFQHGTFFHNMIQLEKYNIPSVNIHKHYHLTFRYVKNSFKINF